MDEEDTRTDYDKPVAYDADGKPLYAHPPKGDPNIPPVVQVVRQAVPMKPHVSPELKAKHDESVAKYPHLNLSEGEYVISQVKRHQIGLFWHYLIGLSLLVLTIIAITKYSSMADILNISQTEAVYYVVLPLILFCFLIVLTVYASYYIFNNNCFFLTNESVIQEIQLSLFSRREQIISLANIEDAGFSQKDMMSHMFNYGSIRLSTEGEETTYRFSFVSNPRHYIGLLNDAVESFKNGRPVEDEEENN